MISPLGPVWGVIPVAAFPVCYSTVFSGAMLGLAVLLFGVPIHVTAMGRRWAWRCSEAFAWPASSCCSRPACWRSSPQGVVLSGGSKRESKASSGGALALPLLSTPVTEAIGAPVGRGNRRTRWAAASLVEEYVRLASEDGEHVIGIVTLIRASKPEVAQLDRLRADHSGPIAAILEQLPSTRDARAASALLEGPVLADGLERALPPTLPAVTAGQCVVPRSIRELLERPPLSPRER